MKYKVLYHYPDGTDGEEEELYDSQDQAEEAGLYGCSCYSQGAEILNLSNPGDYQLDGSEDDCEFEVIQIDN